MSDKHKMRIYDGIAAVREYVDGSQMPRFGGKEKRIIDIDELNELLVELESVIPEDIRRANGVNSDANDILEKAREEADEIIKDANNRAVGIIADANETANETIEKANAEAEELISEHSVTHEAERRAAKLLHKAETNAEIIFNGSKEYANDVFAELEKYLDNYSTLIKKNREELGVYEERRAAAQNNITREKTVQPNRASRYTAPEKEMEVPKEKPAETEYNDSYDEEEYREEADEGEYEDTRKGGFFSSFISRAKKTIGIIEDGSDEYEDDYEDEEE